MNESKILYMLNKYYEKSDYTASHFIQDLRKVMPPVCTKTERLFLDRVRELGEPIGDPEDIEDQDIYLGGESLLFSSDFPGIRLWELVEKKG